MPRFVTVSFAACIIALTAAPSHATESYFHGVTDGMDNYNRHADCDTRLAKSSKLMQKARKAQNYEDDDEAADEVAEAVFGDEQESCSSLFSYGDLSYPRIPSTSLHPGCQKTVFTVFHTEFVAGLFSVNRPVAGGCGKRPRWHYDDGALGKIEQGAEGPVSVNSCSKQPTYNRGHYAACADFVKGTNGVTFVASNYAPQEMGFNRDRWGDLEKYTRGRWAGASTITGSSHTRLPKETYCAKMTAKSRSRTDRSIPLFYYKAMCDDESGKSIAFVSENVASAPTYAMSVSLLNKLLTADVAVGKPVSLFPSQCGVDKVASDGNQISIEGSVAQVVSSVGDIKFNNGKVGKNNN